MVINITLQLSESSTSKKRWEIKERVKWMVNNLIDTMAKRHLKAATKMIMVV